MRIIITIIGLNIKNIIWKMKLFLKPILARKKRSLCSKNKVETMFIEFFWSLNLNLAIPMFLYCCRWFSTNKFNLQLSKFFLHFYFLCKNASVSLREFFPNISNSSWTSITLDKSEPLFDWLQLVRLLGALKYLFWLDFSLHFPL